MNELFDKIEASAESVARQWGWFLALGLALIVLGLVAMIFETSATLAAVIALGVILIIGGFAQLVLMFQSRGAGHVILYLLLGLLDLVVGFGLIKYPAAGALALTLLLAAYLCIGGLLRAFYALWLQFPHYGWVALSGAAMFVLGVLLWLQWPISAAWFIGFAVGLNFVLMGITWSSIAFSLRATLHGPPHQMSPAH